MPVLHAYGLHEIANMNLQISTITSSNMKQLDYSN
ncbi:hypothetical protein T4C_13392 [Trichinella pseudospiralis]|uniref:Uncharacterized protein n=1 Tax=Trichinella pseudospiralis TaxID=6337 RepID=A0A0V1GPK8_TRIPS|nr:hypothetical protein T4E_12397 [Trichinella pseudospiralis]KRZ00214.1 hypothetical protein T4C_13392 [Trichinella pseudospiralis]